MKEISLIKLNKKFNHGKKSQFKENFNTEKTLMLYKMKQRNIDFYF